MLKAFFHGINMAVASMTAIFKRTIDLDEESNYAIGYFCIILFIFTWAGQFLKKSKELHEWLVPTVKAKLFFLKTRMSTGIFVVHKRSTMSAS